jgi:hypothetical protein
MIPLLLAAAAQASPGYPNEVVDDLSVPCLVPCTICHETLAGGTGTVVQDFGKAMIDRGLTGASDYDALHAALDEMTADAVDSDDDGTIDTEELAAGQDPNPDGVAFCEVETLTPHYGCVQSTSGAAATWMGVGAGLVALGLALRR